MIERSGPRILVLGATGLVGAHLVDALDRQNAVPQVRVATRDPARVEALRRQGREAVRLDLDEPGTFAAALFGVDRLYLVTGYTVAMLAQSKTIVDAAAKAGVRHIVHQGVFAAPDCTDPHFVWHQLVECYIEASGIAWTHLHPNVFMEQILGFMRVKGDSFPVFWGDRRVGWIAARDIAGAAARVLVEGPDRHGGRDYWLSSEVANGDEMAAILSDELGRHIRCDLRQPAEAPALNNMEAWYAAAARQFLEQVFDGRMGYIGTIRDDGPFLTGQASTSLRQWVAENRNQLIVHK